MSTRMCRRGLALLVFGLGVLGVLACSGCDDASSSLVPPHAPVGGAVQGMYVIQQEPPDVGSSYLLDGAGQVHAQATVHALGFIVAGMATGQVTLANVQGSVTLELTGPQQPGFSPVPQDFQFTITVAAGAYQQLQGSGTAHLTLAPQPTPPNGAPLPFTMTFASSP